MNNELNSELLKNNRLSVFLKEMHDEAQNMRNSKYQEHIKSFQKEFMTIKLTSHRQAGHTTAILDLIKSNPYELFVVISPNDKLKQRFMHKAKEADGVNLRNVYGYSTYRIRDLNHVFDLRHSLEADRHYLNSITVILDIASIFRQSSYDADELYDLFRLYPNTIFAFIQ